MAKVKDKIERKFPDIKGNRAKAGGLSQRPKMKGKKGSIKSRKPTGLRSMQNDIPNLGTSRKSSFFSKGGKKVYG